MANTLHFFQQQFNRERILIANDASLDQLIIEFVDTLLNEGLQKGASDIHIEPQQHDCRIRIRCDGLLYEIFSTPVCLASRIVTRLKILANLDIGEKRLPQDGRLSFSPTCDIRLSTCPSLHGEKLVLRLLQSSGSTLTLAQLGLSTTQYQRLTETLSAPQGLIIVAGPTGSGKTSTLYAALQFINHAERNIVSIEDPVEITLPGITQINVNPRIGLHFKSILRTVLRQDPDVIMIGEIRDSETAALAIHAAQTGHLVLTTLHANQAQDILSRLQSLGITDHDLMCVTPFMISQRLIRKHGAAGYQGRTAIFAFNHEDNLWQSAQHLLDLNITTHTEVLRVLGKPPHET